MVVLKGLHPTQQPSCEFSSPWSAFCADSYFSSCSSFAQAFHACVDLNPMLLIIKRVCLFFTQNRSEHSSPSSVPRHIFFFLSRKRFPVGYHNTITKAQRQASA